MVEGCGVLGFFLRKDCKIDAGDCAPADPLRRSRPRGSRCSYSPKPALPALPALPGLPVKAARQPIAVTTKPALPGSSGALARDGPQVCWVFYNIQYIDSYRCIDTGV